MLYIFVFLYAVPVPEPRIFYECGTATYQRFTISNCPCSQVIRIQSAEVGFSDQCSLNDATCTRPTNHTAIMRCNGRRSCIFSQNILSYPPEDKLCDEHQNGNLIIRIIYDCLNGKYKKLSYRRETARQLPTWRGVRPSSPLPLRLLWLHLCVWSNPKPATNVRQVYTSQIFS